MGILSIGLGVKPRGDGWEETIGESGLSLNVGWSVRLYQSSQILFLSTALIRYAVRRGSSSSSSVPTDCLTVFERSAPPATTRSFPRIYGRIPRDSRMNSVDFFQWSH